jgi:hypothetical protein
VYFSGVTLVSWLFAFGEKYQKVALLEVKNISFVG